MTSPNVQAAEVLSQYKVKPDADSVYMECAHAQACGCKGSTVSDFARLKSTGSQPGA